jgi:hypothetical protein
MAEKITVWGTIEGIIGNDSIKICRYFKSKEARDKYCEPRYYIVKTQAIKIDPSKLSPALSDPWDDTSIIPNAYEIIQDLD